MEMENSSSSASSSSSSQYNNMTEKLPDDMDRIIDKFTKFSISKFYSTYGRDSQTDSACSSSHSEASSSSDHHSHKTTPKDTHTISLGGNPSKLSLMIFEGIGRHKYNVQLHHLIYPYVRLYPVACTSSHAIVLTRQNTSRIKTREQYKLHFFDLLLASKPSDLDTPFRAALDNRTYKSPWKTADHTFSNVTSHCACRSTVVILSAAGGSNVKSTDKELGSSKLTIVNIKKDTECAVVINLGHAVSQSAFLCMDNYYVFIVDNKYRTISYCRYRYPTPFEPKVFSFSIAREIDCVHSADCMSYFHAAGCNADLKPLDTQGSILSLLVSYSSDCVLATAKSRKQPLNEVDMYFVVEFQVAVRYKSDNGVRNALLVSDTYSIPRSVERYPDSPKLEGLRKSTPIHSFLRLFDSNPLICISGGVYTLHEGDPPHDESTVDTKSKDAFTKKDENDSDPSDFYYSNLIFNQDSTITDSLYDKESDITITYHNYQNLTVSKKFGRNPCKIMTISLSYHSHPTRAMCAKNSLLSYESDLPPSELACSKVSIDSDNIRRPYKAISIIHNSAIAVLTSSGSLCFVRPNVDVKTLTKYSKSYTFHSSEHASIFPLAYDYDITTQNKTTIDQ